MRIKKILISFFITNFFILSVLLSPAFAEYYLAVNAPCIGCGKCGDKISLPNCTYRFTTHYRHADVRGEGEQDEYEWVPDPWDP